MLLGFSQLPGLRKLREGQYFLSKGAGFDLRQKLDSHFKMFGGTADRTDDHFVICDNILQCILPMGIRQTQEQNPGTRDEVAATETQSSSGLCEEILNRVNEISFNASLELINQMPSRSIWLWCDQGICLSSRKLWVCLCFYFF